MSDTSLFIKPGDNFLNQNKFTQISEIRNEGFNTLFRAKRYGKWWLIKALKKELQDDIVVNGSISTNGSDYESYIEDGKFKKS